MNFRTEYKPQPSQDPLDPKRAVTLLGSCFADNIGGAMRRAFWDARVNPCGTLFNPASVAEALRLAASADPRERIERSLAARGDVWVSLLFDSSFAALSREECLQKCLAGAEALRKGIADSQALFITLGTCWIYRCEEFPEMKGETAANCHKFPARMFRRERLGVAECTELIEEAERLARSINPEIRIIYTVSPVRHLRDDFHENTISKSTLILATADREYFPAYEIMMDDLRDYRFYAEDLAHPSKVAEQYIWLRFKEIYLDAKGRERIEKGESLRRRMEHRPLVEGSEEARRFREATEEEIKALGVRI